MNERLKEIAQQADLDWHKHWNDDESNRLELFAELIIKDYRQEWVGLTTDELKEINDRFKLRGPNIPVAFRTVESKLKQKNT